MVQTHKYKSEESNVMCFATFSCTVFTKQQGKQLLAWSRKRTQTEGGAIELGFGPGNQTKCESTLNCYFSTKSAY